MKKTLLITLILLSSQLHSQNLNFEWVKTFGSRGFDHVSKTILGKSNYIFNRLFYRLYGFGSGCW